MNKQHKPKVLIEMGVEDAQELLKHLRDCEYDETVTLEGLERHKRWRQAISDSFGLKTEC